MKKIALSVLDLSPVSAGHSSAEALRNTLDLARLADDLGYRRYWLAEHHNSALIASSSPEIMIGHVASVTKRIRVGSGGVMLPNHAPLKVAESFRTLEALHPGRIDLGLGRAPGTDPKTTLALRGSREALRADDFPLQLTDLMGFLDGGFPEGHPYRYIYANPVGVAPPDVWLLGSSGFSARLAAERGLGFVFAHHINPGPAIESLREYREQFQPSKYLDAPRSALAMSVICAPTDEEAERLARPAELAILQLTLGRRSPLSSVEDAEAFPYTDYDRAQILTNRPRLTRGSPESVHARITELAEAGGVDEVIVTTLTYGHQERCRSYELLAEKFEL